MLEVGAVAPDFALSQTDGSTTVLRRLLDENAHVVVYFFPLAGSPGCTREAQGFRDIFPDLRAHDATVVGISTGTPAELDAFARDNGLPFLTLADPHHQVIEEWGAWRQGTTARVTYIIGKGGIVTHAFPRVDVNRHANDILGTLGGPRRATGDLGGAPTAATTASKRQTGDLGGAPAAATAASKRQTGDLGGAAAAATAAAASKRPTGDLGGSAPAAAVAAAMGEKVGRLGRAALELMISHVEGGGVLPSDVLELASRLAAHKR